MQDKTDIPFICPSTMHIVVDGESVSNAGGAIQTACISLHTASIDETVYRRGFCMRSNFRSSLRVCIEAGCVYLCFMSSHILFVDAWCC